MMKDFFTKHRVSLSSILNIGMLYEVYGKDDEIKYILKSD